MARHMTELPVGGLIFNLATPPPHLIITYLGTKWKTFLIDFLTVKIPYHFD